MKNLLMFAGVALFVVACGGPAPLNEAQKEKLGDYNRSNNTLNALSKQQNAQAFAEETSTEDLQAMQQMIQGRCNVTAVKTPGTSRPSAAPGATIDGPNCPINMTASVAGDEKNMTFKLNYESKDAAFTEKAKFSKLVLEGGMKVDGTNTDINAKGNSDSKKYGHVDFEMKAKTGFDMQKMELTMDLYYLVKFPDFTAEIKTVKKDNGYQVQLNGKELTEEDFKKLNFAQN